MNKKFSFGNAMFQILDAWPTNQSAPVHVQPAHSIDPGDIYLSFVLTPEQQRALGNTKASCIRIQIRKAE